MTSNELNNKYFEWMYQLVCNNQRLSYRKLLSYLHNVEFIYIIEMDGNRAEDGIDLRYRFGYEQGYDRSMIATLLDNRPCSVLEMLIALAIRCEEHIMSDMDDSGTDQWFWNMINNLGLGFMYDSNFDEDYVEDIVSRFLYRKYKRNGEGGLFTVKHRKSDLRNVEIWYQMCWYLNEILKKRGIIK